MSNTSESSLRPLEIAEVERISILGSESIIGGFHLTDYIWNDIFSNFTVASKYVLITDTNLAPLYLSKYKESFDTVWKSLKGEKEHPKLLTYVLPPGETSKSRATKAMIEDWMLKEKCTRDTMVLALGGGVIGDLVGYIAATFMRGVRFVQIPTSLLAMVDSSIGGKTAIDVPAGKNLIGAFWQPIRIFMDMAVLSTLPPREFSNGMAEVVKTAAIWDSNEFDVLEASVAEVRQAVLEGQRHATGSGKPGLTIKSRTREQSLLLRVITASARVKAYVVTHDERESGMRGLLNFGHSIGHAIEAIVSPQVLHGECVAIGCVLEAELSRRIGHIGEVSVARLARCLRAYGLPTTIDDPIIRRLISEELMAQIRPERILDIMSVDKKNIGAQKRVVLLKSLGKTVEMKASNVSDSLILEVISPGVLVHPISAADSSVLSKPKVIVPPGSKSISNRALLLAALGTGKCRIRNLLHSDDTQVMLGALQAMDGCSVAWEDDGDTLVVGGGGGMLKSSDNEVYLGNAGTAARFLTSTVNLISEGTTELTGNARMKQRPIGPLVDALRTNGCTIDYMEGEGCLPLRISHNGQRFPGGHIQLAASVSSQYVSAILLCAPYAESPVRLELVGGKVISQPYIDMTMAMMAQFGCKVERVAENEYLIPRGAYTNPPEYIVESDASSATYPLAFAAITGTTCTVPNIGSSSLQGDARFAVDVLRPMGCTVEQTVTSTTVTGPRVGELCALGSIDMEPMTDAFLTCAVLAAVATGNGGVTRISGIANQHVKECDRIAAMVTELSKFGVTAVNHPDGIDVYGVPTDKLTQGVPSVHCYDDHRVAMSLSLLACVSRSGAELRERKCVGKTWPQWWDVLGRDLGIAIDGSDPAPEKTAGAAYGNNASVVVIGMRGAGKSTLGRAAARALGRKFVDMDEHLEKVLGQTIPELIACSGWDEFRRHEGEQLKCALNGQFATSAVIACGGGVVESAENRAMLKEYMARGGVVVCITPNIEHVSEYLAQDKTRPAYSANSDVNSVYERRKPFYAECSNYEFLSDLTLPRAVSEDANYHTWAVVERDFSRLVAFAIGDDLNRVDLAHQSFFVSLTAADMREYLPAKKRLSQITAGAQAIELRADLLLNSKQFVDADLDDSQTQEQFVEYVQQQFTILRHASPLPVVFTVRTSAQGGVFPTAANGLRMRLLRLAIRWGAEYVDVEVDNAARKLYEAKQQSLIIASYHDTTGNSLKWQAPSDFARSMLARARECGDIAKLISVAHSWDDNVACSEFVERNHSVDSPLIALNMGYAGQASRVLCPCLTPVTHKLLTAAAAPGQLSVQQINEARALLGRLSTRQFFLFGSPIAHSPSPAMHNAAFAALGLPHVYGLHETQTVDALADVLAAPDFGGASVTIPHKEAVIALLDELTPTARRIGAVNTVIPVVSQETRRLVGDNTDCRGIVDALRNAQSMPFADARALVIGAGGTARAALFALHVLGVRTVAIYNRTQERAEGLAAEFGDLFGEIRAVENVESVKADYVVGTVPGSVGVSEALFADGTGVALDMAYKPRWTPLLEAAHRANWKVVHGVDVLIRQGVHQLEAWTHLTAPVEEMERAVYEKYDAEF